MTGAQRPRPRSGVYEASFWNYVQNCELRLQKCSQCSQFRYPPGPVCSRCLSDQYEWQKVAGTGELISWATFHRQYLPQIPVPFTIASVMLSEGPMLIADIDTDPVLLKIGLPATLIFEDVATGGEVWKIYRWTTALD